MIYEFSLTDAIKKGATFSGFSHVCDLFDPPMPLVDLEDRKIVSGEQFAENGHYIPFYLPRRDYVVAELNNGATSDISSDDFVNWQIQNLASSFLGLQTLYLLILKTNGFRHPVFSKMIWDDSIAFKDSALHLAQIDALGEILNSDNDVVNLVRCALINAKSGLYNFSLFENELVENFETVSKYKSRPNIMMTISEGAFIPYWEFGRSSGLPLKNEHKRINSVWMRQDIHSLFSLEAA